MLPRPLARTKRCKDCRAILPRDAFYADRSRCDGLQRSCRACDRTKLDGLSAERRELRRERRQFERLLDEPGWRDLDDETFFARYGEALDRYGASPDVTAEAAGLPAWWDS